MNTALHRAARPLEFLAGAVFLLSALLKLQDPQLFAVQIHEYQVLHSKDLLAPAALFFLTLEMMLGTAMLVGLRLRGSIIWGTLALLLFFTALIAYAWRVHGIEDCGCMGGVKMGPGVSILKNAVLMLMLGWAWLGLARANALGTMALADKAAATLAVGVVTLVVAWPAVYRAEPAPAPPAERPAQEVPTDTPEQSTPAKASSAPFHGFSMTDAFGDAYDLGQGRYLVAILSATCDHCMASVPLFNEYTLFPGELPPLAALCYEPRPGDLETFRAQTFPEFPILSLSNDFIRFSRFIGREPPRLHLVEDGHSRFFWDETQLPTAMELIEFLSRAQNLAPIDPGGTKP